jgi:diketogulonate reductase-like aldo/keto reductase
MPRFDESDMEIVVTTNRVTADGNAYVLPNGNTMPMLGLGLWQVPNGPECVRAVRWALDLGYRHIDTAQAYGNEESVGKALKESGIDRDDVFITTKFNPGNPDPVQAAEASLRLLGVGSVDLYLVHWPQGGPTWAWPGMERAHELGHARSIGISNFNTDELHAVISTANILPMIDQVHFNPTTYRRGLMDACLKQRVTLEAYSPLGTGRLLTDPTVTAIAARIAKTPSQVLLRWCVQHQVAVVSKSMHRERLEENMKIFDFALSAQDMTSLDELDQTDGTNEALERQWW